MTKVQQFIAEKCGEGGEYVLDERSTKLEKALKGIIPLCIADDEAEDIAIEAAKAALADNVAGEAELLERYDEWLAEDRKISGVPDAKQHIMELELRVQDLRGALKVWQESDSKQRHLLEEQKAKNARLVLAMAGLFEQCVMIHKYGGDICNQREADAAIAEARASIEDNEKGGAS
jgi:hypothetical protein